MVSDWVETTLGEIAQNISRPFDFNAFEEVTFINTGDVLEGHFLHSNTISKVGLPGQAKKKIKEGDILFSEIRPANKRFALVDFDPTGYVVSTKFMVIKQLSADIDNRFFYILLTNQITLHEFQRIAESRSGTFPQITFDAVAYFPVKIPPLPEQKAIAHILGSLDDKIELNRQMNEMLEAMAQALFKSWFVDFDPVIDNAIAAGNPIPDEWLERAEQRQAMLSSDSDNQAIRALFPDTFEFTEEMGWIPKGWAVNPIENFGKVVTGKTPPKKVDNAYSENGVPFITPTDIDDSPFIFATNRYLSKYGREAVKNSKISSGSICVTCIGSQMGKTTISPSDAITNQQINTVTGCEQVWRNYLFFNLRRRREEIFLLGSSGSTMPIINKSSFEMIPIISPNEELLHSIDIHFQSTLDSIFKNIAQSDSLAKLRDTLLPKLLSGELRIPDAAAMLDDV